jgi:DnaJ-class molecular chaperone
MKCPKCKGKGYIPLDSRDMRAGYRCDKCKGKGRQNG